MSKKKLTPEQKDHVILQASQEVPAKEISRQAGIPINQVIGTIRTAINQGRLTPSNPSPEARMQNVVPSAASPAQPSQPSQPSLLPEDGNVWKTGAPGAGGTFVHPAQLVEYKVERIEPKDGILFVQPDDITDDELGKKCGEGNYRIWRREGTRVPVYREVIISSSYGAPKFPRVGMESRPRQNRPFGHREDDDHDRLERPVYRPVARPEFYERPQFNPDRTMGDFARHGASVNESIAVTAISKMSEMNERQLDRLEKDRARDNEPSSVIQTFLEKQQEQDLKRRQAEDEAEQKRRTKDQEEFNRREQEKDAAHRRDMDRAKADSEARLASEREARQTLLDLEKAKLDLIKAEAKSQQDMLRGELDRLRAEAKEERATLQARLETVEGSVEARVAEVKAEVDKELEKERKNLGKEHELKEKALTNEHSLKQDMLKLREEIIKNSQGDEIAKMIAKLAEGLERVVKEVVELKKIEAVSAEGHMAKVGQTAAAGGADVNVQSIQPGQQGLPEPAAPAAFQPKPGNGHSEAPAAQPQTSQIQSAVPTADNAEKFVQQIAQDPFFIQVITEWGNHVKAGAKATTFTNMFMEWMRDDGTPEAARARKACSIFVNHMQIRGWAEMHELLKPAIPAAYKEIFQLPHATEFYEQFRTMVVDSVDDYWVAYYQQKMAAREAAKQQAAQPQPPVVTATPVAPAAEPPAAPEIPAAPAMTAV